MSEIPNLRYDLEATDLIQGFESPIDGIMTAAAFVEMANIALKSAGVELVLKVDELQLKDEWPSDAVLIDREIRRATEAEENVSDAGARVIAAQLHGGQDTAMYALASTGAIERDRLLSEIEHEVSNERTPTRVATWLVVLRRYALEHHNRAPVKGWSGLWLHDPSRFEEENE